MSTLKKIYNRVQDGIEYGWIKDPTVHIENIVDSGIFEDLKPVFFLSTGRCGTLLFTKLLSNAQGVNVFHDPIPNLSLQSKSAWEMNYTQQVMATETLRDLFLASRELFLYKTARYGKRYIETNRNITFFAPTIKEIIPSAQFVHIHRHPADFIRSGMRRGWYTGAHPHDQGRLTPVSGDPYADRWPTLSSVGKIAWLWEMTNAFIDTFSESLGEENFLRFNFDELGVESVQKMLGYLGLQISTNRIKKALLKPVNIQKTGEFPTLDKWSHEDRDAMIEICGERASKYGYEL